MAVMASPAALLFHLVSFRSAGNLLGVTAHAAFRCWTRHEIDIRIAVANYALHPHETVLAVFPYIIFAGMTFGTRLFQSDFDMLFPLCINSGR